MPEFVPQSLDLLATDPEWDAVEGEASEASPKSFTMRAYTGAPMVVAGYMRPIVVDLDGVKVAASQVPILRGHDTNRLVGHGAVEVSDKGINVTGLVSADNEHAREVVGTAKNGFPWQASIGATVAEIDVLGEKESTTVNGRKVKGPAYVARKSTINEVSFVPLGADRRTSAKVAASARKENQMDPQFAAWLEAKGVDADDLNEALLDTLKASFDAEQKTTEPPAKPSGGSDELKASRKARADEAARVAAIEAKASEYRGLTIEADGTKVDLAAHAIGEGWTPDAYELEAMRSARPKAPAVHSHSKNASAEVLEAALCLSAGLETETAEKSFAEKTLDAADRHFRGMGLQEFVVECAQANGYSGGGANSFRRDHRGLLEAAFSTASISGILGNTANKFLLESFMFVEQKWRTISTRRSVSNFQTSTSYRLTGAQQYEEVGPAGELKHGTFDEESYSNRAKTHGLMLAITRTMQINDDLGALTSLLRQLGRGAGLKLNDVFWTAFLDNSAFFTSGRNNYFDGASSSLQSSSLQTAEQMLMDQVDADGKPIAATGRYLLGPTAIKVDAEELFVSTNLNSGGSSTKAKIPNRNVFAGKYEPVCSTYLSNSTYTGNSSTAWYLLADPRDIPVIEVAFLNGVETPTVESSDADFNTLGISMRGYHDFGVTKQDHRGGVKSKGAA